MKKFVAMSAVAAMAIMANASTDAEEIAKLKEELSTLKETVKQIKIHDAADNVKFSANLRAAVDSIGYTSAEGKSYSNANLMTNRLLLGMAAQPADNLTFHGLLSYNKAYGAAPAGANGMPQRGYGYDTFDWVINENLTDNTLKVKEASFFYYGDMGVPYTVSVGRRPSTDGFLANYREAAAKGKSPLGHSINVEYDGASFLLRDLTDFGTSFKICAGRGLTNARARFNMDGGFESKGDYSEDGDAIDSVDMYGVIFVPYDDGQYKVSMMGYHATNLPGFTLAEGTVTPDGADGFSLNSGDNAGMVSGISPVWSGDPKTDPTATFQGVKASEFNANGIQMKSLGDFDGQVISFQSSGIGDFGIDFLDDTNFFFSYARSITTPNNDYTVLDTTAFDGFKGATMSDIMAGLAGMESQSGQDMDGDGTVGSVTDPSTAMVAAANGAKTESGMLGSTDSETGSSIWLGLTIPAMFTEDGRLGFEYNKGDKYWRSFTYGEDTMIGSKMATRGSAVEVYYNQPLVEQYLSMQLRYTSISYEYTGSQGFFGAEGTPMTMDEAKAMGMDPIESANDIRLSFTYDY
jgi:hypothetical protein